MCTRNLHLGGPWPQPCFSSTTKPQTPLLTVLPSSLIFHFSSWSCICSLDISQRLVGKLHIEFLTHFCAFPSSLWSWPWKFVHFQTLTSASSTWWDCLLLQELLSASFPGLQIGKCPREKTRATLSLTSVGLLSVCDIDLSSSVFFRWFMMTSNIYLFKIN